MDDVHLSGAAILVIGTLLSALGAVVTFLFKLLLKSKDDQYADIKIERDNYKSMATEAINLLEDVTNLTKYTAPSGHDPKSASQLGNRLQDITEKLGPDLKK